MFFHNENTTYNQLDLCIRFVRVIMTKGMRNRLSPNYAQPGESETVQSAVLRRSGFTGCGLGAGTVLCIGLIGGDLCFG